MEAIFLGIDLLLGYAFWRFMWRKTALDKYRDRLFDLRDEVKVYFIERGHGIENPLYLKLRELLNGHIRYTETLTLRLFMAETFAMATHPEIAQALKAQLNERFKTDDPELEKFIFDVRSRAVIILTGHMAESSFTFLMLFPIFYPLVIADKVITSAKAFSINHNAKLISGIRTALRFAPIAGLMLAMPARAGIIDPSFDANIVEEYSFQSAPR